MRERWLCCAVGLGLSALVAPAAGDDTPVFRSGAELVVLDLVARDHRGALVRDLRADEIEVYEDGKRQQALEFRFVAPEAEPVAIGPTAPSFAVAGGPLAAAGRSPSRPDLVALVFDQISAAGRALALQAGRGFLESQRGDGAYLAVFRLDRPLRMASGFTREAGSLRDAIEAATTLRSTPAFVSGVAGISAALSGSRNAGDPRQAGFDSRELRPSHSAHDFDADGSGVRHALAVAVPLARVAFRRDERQGRYTARVSVLALVRDSRGDVVEKLSQDYLLEGPLAELAATRARRLTFARAFRLRPGRYEVDTAVRDGFADRIGCSRLELPVAAPAPGLRLSSVVPIAAVSPASGAADAAGDPFRVGELRLTPALPAALAREPGQDQLALYFVVYAPVGGTPPALRLELSRDGRVVRRGALPLPAADASGRIEHVARVPLGALAPGLYSVRLIVSEGAASAAEETTVRLAAGGD